MIVKTQILVNGCIMLNNALLISNMLLLKVIITLINLLPHGMDNGDIVHQELLKVFVDQEEMLIVKLIKNGIIKLSLVIWKFQSIIVIVKF